MFRHPHVFWGSVFRTPYNWYRNKNRTLDKNLMTVPYMYFVTITPLYHTKWFKSHNMQVLLGSSKALFLGRFCLCKVRTYPLCASIPNPFRLVYYIIFHTPFGILHWLGGLSGLWYFLITLHYTAFPLSFPSAAISSMISRTKEGDRYWWYRFLSNLILDNVSHITCL